MVGLASFRTGLIEEKLWRQFGESSVAHYRAKLLIELEEIRVSPTYVEGLTTTSRSNDGCAHCGAP